MKRVLYRRTKEDPRPADGDEEDVVVDVLMEEGGVKGEEDVADEDDMIILHHHRPFPMANVDGKTILRAVIISSSNNNIATAARWIIWNSPSNDFVIRHNPLGVKEKF